ncbi:hypothetical protein RS130_22780 [Paraglaciecola aquimarina]|uniref:Uncharacterized protein n=1 Tax=Paraglaciecola aquimarina TaxID=1235557 RepID=A0ABU3T268_9ALTE|nr:hypothetical protein [Paraglaciecola aquimarina]MDU0356338.1 hypothetical protein [Paraglaciecola aquimarina]
MHSFSDQSGCVFLELQSADTLSVLMSETEIVKVLSGDITLDDDDKQKSAIDALIQKNILLPLDRKCSDDS